MRQSTMLAGLMIVLCALTYQNAHAQMDAEIDRNSISVHRVRRGDMPIRLMPGGEITSLTPPEVSVTVPSGTNPSPQVGQKASVQFKPPEVIVGSIVDMDRATLLDAGKVTIRLNEPFRGDAAVRRKVGTLIEVGALKDVVYFEKPATARANSEMPLFVLEPNGEFAKRTMVRFGRQSGALIEVLSGLEPEDLVIVTDTSELNGFDRVRLVYTNSRFDDSAGR
jgi:hypothetical protein